MKNASPRTVEGTLLKWPDGVPVDALYVEATRNDACVTGVLTYATGKMQVAWAPDGSVLSERPFDRNGLEHGLEVSRFEHGAVEWQVPWVHGFMQGWAEQFDEDGRGLFKSHFERGTGTDLWVQGSEVVELRQLQGNERHGVERWGHPRLPYEEAFYLRGKRSGVFRRWEGEELERTFPRFFVDDEEVSDNEYLQARIRRAELPAFEPAANRRIRPMLQAFESIWLRPDVRVALMRTPGVDDVIGCGARETVDS